MITTESEFLRIESDFEEGTEIENVESLDEGELNPSISSHKRFVLEKADRSLSELHRWYKSGRIYLNPEWQRNYVWDSSIASKLIESFLLDIPVPVVYFAKSESGKYEVIDGLQRLTSVFEKWRERLKEVMSDSQPQDGQRVFSRQLKEEKLSESAASYCRVAVKAHGSGGEHRSRVQRLTSSRLRPFCSALCQKTSWRR